MGERKQPRQISPPTRPVNPAADPWQIRIFRMQAHKPRDFPAGLLPGTASRIAGRRGLPQRSAVPAREPPVAGGASHALFSSTFRAYISSCRRKPAMAINGRRNKPIGPGGSTRRLHQGAVIRSWSTQPSSGWTGSWSLFPAGGEIGSTRA